MRKQRSRIIFSEWQAQFWPTLLLLVVSVVASLAFIVIPVDTTHAQGLPDLVVQTVSGPLAANTEQSIVVETTVENQGSDVAGENFLVGVYLSEDDIITTGDVLLGSQWVYGLAAGQQASRSIGGTIPRNLNGSYYIGVVVDYANYVQDESDETNNSLAYGPVCISSCAPVVDAGGPYGGDEGSAISLAGATASSPRQGILTFGWSVDSALCTFSDPSVLNPILTCEDDGSYVVTLTVTDELGSAASSDAGVTVNNVAPTLDSVSAPTEPVAIGQQPVSVQATFSDPGTADTHTVTWDWGDLSTDSQSSALSPASAGHSYATAGVYTVAITITDDDGGTASATYEYIVIYNNEAGFVTGGGWLWSEIGSCQFNNLCAEADGEAIFGFVSRYQQGATEPVGNTQFRFRAGGLNFLSERYEWLVVNQAGTNAQYKGSGTINSERAPNGEAYKFMLWAKDDDPTHGDTFRLKIWFELDGGEKLVYDNGSDQPIGGGDIQIHGK